MTGLLVGAIAAAVCAAPLMLQKNGIGLLVAFVVFVGTVALWTVFSRFRSADTIDKPELAVVSSRRQQGRMWLGVAALLIGPIGGAIVGYLIVLRGDVNPLDVAITIRIPMFLGGVAGFMVACGVFVTTLLE